MSCSISTIYKLNKCNKQRNDFTSYGSRRGWSAGAVVLGKLPMPGRPTNFDFSRARVYCAGIRSGRDLFGHFYSRLSFPFCFSLSLGDGPI